MSCVFALIDFNHFIFFIDCPSPVGVYATSNRDVFANIVSNATTGEITMRISYQYQNLTSYSITRKNNCSGSFLNDQQIIENVEFNGCDLITETRAYKRINCPTNKCKVCIFQ